MNRLTSPWRQVALWKFDRGSWPYDVVWLVILLFVFLFPAQWLGDPMVTR